jgi:hypothetical protein
MGLEKEISERMNSLLSTPKQSITSNCIGTALYVVG